MKNKIRFLFLNMVNPKRNTEKLYPPLGPAYLVSYINKYFPESKNIEFKMISNNFEENINHYNPNIIGITCVSQNYDYAKKIAKYAKEKKIQVLIGGSHISLCPYSFDKSMDVGIIGEGEETFLELMKIYLKNNKFLKLNKIKGIIFFEGNKLIITKKRELIKNIDTIPIPDRTLFKIDTHEAYMFSSRGCPYKCVFCSSSRLWEMVRFHSAKYVFNEIKELTYKYNINRIAFWDDLFIANKKRVKELVKLLEKEGLTRKIEFHVGARANLVDEDICKLLKRMNVKSTNMGLESGSPKILKYLKGDSVSVDDNFNAIELLKKYNIRNCFATFIIGTHIDTKETILETLNFIKKSKLDSFTVFILTPLPGTPVWDYAQKENFISKDLTKFDWETLGEGFEVGQPKIHLAKNLNKKELYNLYIKFMIEKKKREFYMIFRTAIFNPKKAFLYIKNKLFN